MLYQRVARTQLPLVSHPADSIHRAGRLEVRLAASAREVHAAQALRYRIFCQEMGARPDFRSRRLKRDLDAYDQVADHLLVIDHDARGGPAVVGTYRLLRQLVAERHGGFYSAREFDLTPLLEAGRTGGQLLELGRSCVAPAWRSSQTIGLLWRGIASYLAMHDVGYLFGCASFPGTNPQMHAAELSWLHQNRLAPHRLRARAHDGRHVPMDRLAPDAYDARAAQRALPPLIKGYLRVGAMVGDGAYIDRQFNTVDVFVVMPVDRIAERYRERFGSGANDRI